MIKSLSYCLVVMVIMVGCKSMKPTASSDAETYKEDLSALRPQYDAPEILIAPDTAEVTTTADYANSIPVADVTKELNGILDSVDILKEDVKFIPGYTIQVYWGTNSKAARLARGKIYSILPESNPQLDFSAPNFIVKVGKYYSIMEAQGEYSKLKSLFPNATIVPERIYIQ